MTKKHLVIFSLFLLLILILRFVFVFFFSEKMIIPEGEYISYVVKINQEPKTSGEYQFFQTEVGGREIGVLASSFPQYHYGDRVRISGKVSYEKENSNQNFQLLNLTNEKRLVMFTPKIEKLETEGDVFTFIMFIRQRLISSFSQVLSPSGSALLLGITFGIKDSMPKEFLNEIRITGLMHVIAASGMNVTMLAGFLTTVTVLFFKRRTSLVISIIGILFYASLAGFQASIVRASIMAIIVFSAQILGRQAIAGYTLFLTAFVMLFLDPNEISDIGFQLSFLSTLGILYIQPLFSRFESFQKSVVGESVITTLCAQISTLPIMLLYFGNYSIWSIVVNAAVLWTIPPLMLLGAIAGLFTFIFTPLVRVFLFLCLPFLVYFEKVAGFFSTFPGSIQNVIFPLPFVLGYYLILMALILSLRKRGEELKS
jgi:competence protein ComEC